MSGTVDFPSNGKTTSGYLAGDSGPGVIVIQEWWGLNDQIKGVAERFGAAGFRALAPDLYRGTVARSPDEAGKLFMALDIARAERDLRGAVDYLRGLRPGSRVGTVGYCMGGALSLFAACAAGDKVGACVIYYGGHPRVTYDFDGLRAPVLGHWAEHDTFANANIAPLQQALAEHSIGYQFHTYPGTKHAFANELRPEVFDAKASQLSWQRTLAFFRNNLT